MKGGAQDKIRKQTKKALIVTTVSGFVPQFEMNNVRILQELGYEVHYASNFRNPSYGNDNSRLAGTGILCHQIDLERSPFRICAALRACRQLKALLEREHFDLLHCHTPMGGAVARLAAARAGAGQKKRFGMNSIYNHDKPFVIYTAHGFHFYRGAPLINWLLYYPAERWLARYTDVLITINEEDYARAQRFCRGKKTKVERLIGAGADISFFRGDDLPEDGREKMREVVRRKLHAAEDEVVFLSVGELIPRKNHRLAIKAFAELEKERLAKGREAGDWLRHRRRPEKKGGPETVEKSENSRRFRYFICGKGVQRRALQRQIDQAGLSGRVRLLGYRRNIRAILYAADVFVFPSLQEGMPMAMIEAAAAGLPIIASDIRGNREVAESWENTESFTDWKELKQMLKKALKQEQNTGKVEKTKKMPAQEYAAAQEYIAKPGQSLTQRCLAGRKLDRFDKRQAGRRMKKIYNEAALKSRS
ncbi:MAG: glycosyltransferase [Lachnospiraceae bacterium]|nr:glycosyltransferase [Lachnospiraceae bacterium]